MRTRRRGAVLVVLALATALLAGSGGWVLAARFQSPAQREAAARAPAPSPVTVPVVWDSLGETASARGVVGREAVVAVRLQPAEGRTVVTNAPTPVGAEVRHCGVLVELNGRPVLAVGGRFPFYRDLVAGDTGPDVEQLQAALGACGQRVAQDGVFGARTERAVRAVYRAAGYPAPLETAPPADVTVSDDAATPDGTADAAAPVTSRLVVLARELAVVPSLPGTVVTLPGVGADTGDGTAQVEVGSGALVARVTVAASLAVRLAPGVPVTLRAGDGSEVGAVVRSVPDGEDQAADVVVEVSPADGVPLPPHWSGEEVLAVLTLGAEGGEALVVPSSAVVSDGGEDARVLRRAEDGSFEAVPVVEENAVGGRSAVRPLDDGALAAGDQVQVP